MKSIVLVYGGEGSEHEISKISASYIKEQIDTTKFNLSVFELDKNFNFIQDSKKFILTPNRTLNHKDEKIVVDYVIPCLHGYPGETGDFQSILNAYQIPYLGCDSESSKICFNKFLTKLVLENIGINTTPFITVDKDNMKPANLFFENHKEVFVKATNQGSSIGCYKISNKIELQDKINMAFTLSSHVILEKALKPREIEVAAFEFEGKVHITSASEVSHEGSFYDYDEKYSGQSSAKTTLVPILNDTIKRKITELSFKIFKSLKLKDLSRIDFFLVDEEIYVNEINTFPGMTSISLFPKMMEHYGVSFKSFIEEKLDV
jgi:D-alanine-D-alanine ligase